MDKTRPKPTRSKPRKGRSGSCIIGTLSRLAGRLYTAVSRSTVGRALTGYRRLDSALRRGEHRPGQPVSRARIPVADAVKHSHVLAILRGIPRVLYELPLRFYGLFCMMYALFCGTLYFLAYTYFPDYLPTYGYLAVAALMLLISFPMIISRSTLRRAVAVSVMGRLILKRYLCIPLDPPPRKPKKMPVYLPFVSAFAAMLFAVGALFTHELLLLPIVAALILLGLIFSYPEAGVLLTTACLPVVWLYPRAILPLAVLVLLTWCSYGLKLLQLHRTMRRDLLDLVVLVLLGLCLISGVGGVIAGTGQALPGLLLFTAVSEYFLIVRLMKTRAHICRCLIGVGATSVVITVAFFLGRTDASAMDWLTGSRGGDLLAGLFSRLREVAVGAGGGAHVLLSILLIPLMYAFMLRTRRLSLRVAALVLWGLNLYMIVIGSSFGALIVLACVTLLYCLLMDHRTLVAGALLLPGAVGAAGWYLTWRGSHTGDTVRGFAQAVRVREVRYAELWRDVCRSPIGYGAGADCAGGNLALEVLITLGWPGLIVAMLVLFLLIQKSLTALAYATTVSDRALTVGLLGGLSAALLRGATHGFLTVPHAFFLLILLCALISAFANILFEEHDVREAESMSAPAGADRVYRRR